MTSDSVAGGDAQHVPAIDPALAAPANPSDAIKGEPATEPPSLIDLDWTGEEMAAMRRLSFENVALRRDLDTLLAGITDLIQLERDAQDELRDLGNEARALACGHCVDVLVALRSLVWPTEEAA